MGHPDSNVSSGLHVHVLPPGPAFLAECARHFVDVARAFLPDLSSLVVVLPNQHIAPAFRRALAAAAGAVVWMPQIFTLTGLAREPLAAIEKDPESARLLRLYDALLNQPLFKSQGVWQLATELAQLFDELTERGEPLPATHEALAAVLARGYDTAPGAALSFEAQFVHVLWQADREGLPSLAAALQQALVACVAAAPAGVPMFLMGDGKLSATEQRFVTQLAEKTAVHVFVPQSCGVDDALLATLHAAWPMEEATAPLRDRARALAVRYPQSVLAGRVQLMACASLEQEAANVAQRVRERLEAGAGSIALIAADRVAARRARAALAEQGIEAVDETGWLLSTTRAAAFVDALLQAVAQQGYHRAVLDVVKSPFVCADWAFEVRSEALWRLERAIGRGNFVSGWAALSRLLSRVEEAQPALPLMERLLAAVEALSGRRAGVAEWIARLHQAIDALGAREALAADAAGSEVLALLATRAAELASHPLRLDFNDWRDWLSREFERAMFRDGSLQSPVVITHLAAARLRRFDCAVVVGADREHVSPAGAAAIFATDSVRRELGLSTRAEARARLREDLVQLIAGANEVLMTRQAFVGDEHNLPCPELEVLDMVHLLAFGSRLTVPARLDAVRGDAGGVAVAVMPAPKVAAEQVPPRLSASGYASLVACPYQYFARHVLGLGEQHEVSEALEKRDYGDVVHDVLHRFHSAFECLAEHDAATLVARLAALTEEAFASVVEDNFLEHAWRLRWQVRIPAYVAWACAREADGWRWQEGERSRTREVALDDGAALTLRGRIDRVDHNGSGTAVLDYKTQSLQVLRDKVKKVDLDVQLPFYALLQPGAVAQAAYVALDDDAVGVVPLPEVGAVADQHFARIKTMFSQMRNGALMPAHGAATACGFCEMQGVCRKPYHGEA